MSAATSQIRNHAFGYLVLAALFLISCLQWTRDTRDRIDEILHGDEAVGSSFDLDPLTLAAVYLDPTARAAGLQEGDIVLGVEGHPLEGFSDYHGPLRRAKFGDRLRIRVRSKTPAGPVEKDLFIRPPRFTYLGFAKGDSAAYSYIVALRIAIPFLCMAIGFWVAAVRIGDIAAWQLLVLMLSVANTIQDSRTFFGNQDALQPFLTAFSFGFSTLSPMALAFFGITFPERLGFDRRFPWIKWLVFGPLLVRAALAAIGGGLSLHHFKLSLALWPLAKPVVDVGMYLTPAALLTFFVALGYKTVKASSRDARRRLLLLDAGVTMSFVPLIVLFTLNITQGVPFQGWTAVIPVVMLLIFPLTMAYVILVHRAMDVRVVIRQGLQYLLAAGSVRLLQVAISMAIIVTAATMSADTSVTRRIVFISAGFVLLAGVRGFAQHLRGWIDRRFFRGDYQADRMLADLADRVSSIVDTQALFETVAARIVDSLHVLRLALFVRDGAAFRPAYAIGDAPSLPADSLAIRSLAVQHRALPVYFDDPHSWIRGADAREADNLRRLDAQLLLPLGRNGKLLGLISLGPKRSEEPYSPSDVRLLEAVATQTALALENSQLAAAVSAEVAQREIVHRELAIARDVQKRLFPQRHPEIKGLDYAGHCRPAQSVGGDSYDFLEIAGGRLGLAIGDVSGKGVPAALVMASLQSSLRGLAVGGAADPAALICHMNRLLSEAAPRGRFATLFFGVYDPASRTLHYGNAGHNAPLLLRVSGAIDRLDPTGIALNLARHSRYGQVAVTLDPGDILIAFTDGVSEAMNLLQEEFGEDRLAATVASCSQLPPKEIIDRVLAAVDHFAAGAPQHDDITLIVVRVTQ